MENIFKKYVYLFTEFLLLIVICTLVLAMQYSGSDRISSSFLHLNPDSNNKTIKKVERTGLSAKDAVADLNKMHGQPQRLVKVKFGNSEADTVKPSTARQTFSQNLAIILNGEPQYRQDGFGNILIQKQDWPSFNNRWVEQSGSSNYARQVLDHTLFSEVLISSKGTANTVLQNISGVYDGTVSVVQKGSFNYASQSLCSHNKPWKMTYVGNDLIQTGSFNIYESHQSGVTNVDSTIQKVRYNRVKIHQRGQNNKATIKQDGSNNSVHISQN